MSSVRAELSRELKDARLLSRLSALFSLFGLATWFFLTNVLNREERSAIISISFTAAIVLGSWSFRFILAAPRPLPVRFQIVIGMVLGYLPWTLVVIARFFNTNDLQILASLLFVVLMVAWSGLLVTGAFTRQVVLSAMTAILPFFSMLIIVQYLNEGPD